MSGAPAGACVATALIADDEPLLRERLRSLLARLWPELRIVAEARNGREAVELFDRHEPAVAFLDVQMPGLNGVEAARSLRGRTQIVFVTAYQQYAVQAFEQAAIDYVIKPFDETRLAETVSRLRERLALRPSPAVAPNEPPLDALLERVAARLREQERGGAKPAWLQWIRASAGTSVRLIPVDEIVFLKSDEKYTLVVWDGGESVIRKTIRELADELDPDCFAQVHRSVIVNLRRVSEVVRGPNETAEVRLKGRAEVLPVSRSYLHLFRQM